MTLVGKIFIVLVLLMSVLFMGLTVAVYATHRNWKDHVKDPETGLEQQVAYWKKKNEEMQLELEKVRDSLALERGARRKALAVLETRAAQLREQLAQRQTQYVELLAQSRTAVQTVDTTQNTLKRLKDEVETLRSQVRETLEDRDRQFAKVVSLTDQLHDMRGQLGRLETRKVELLADMNRMTDVMEQNGINPSDGPTPEIPPPLDGVVMAVAREIFVQVSLGSDDGLRTGHQLDISRRGKFVGRTVVRRIDPDRAVAEVLDDYRKDRVQKGDIVRTVTKTRTLSLTSR